MAESQDEKQEFPPIYNYNPFELLNSIKTAEDIASMANVSGKLLTDFGEAALPLVQSYYQARVDELARGMNDDDWQAFKASKAVFAQEYAAAATESWQVEVMHMLLNDFRDYQTVVSLDQFQPEAAELYSHYLAEATLAYYRHYYDNPNEIFWALTAIKPAPSNLRYLMNARRVFKEHSPDYLPDALRRAESMIDSVLDLAKATLNGRELRDLAGGKYPDYDLWTAKKMLSLVNNHPDELESVLRNMSVWTSTKTDELRDFVETKLNEFRRHHERRWIPIPKDTRYSRKYPRVEWEESF